MEASRATCPTRDPPSPPPPSLLRPLYQLLLYACFGSGFSLFPPPPPPPLSLSTTVPVPALAPVQKYFTSCPSSASNEFVNPTDAQPKQAPRGAHETLGGGIVRVSSLCDLCFRNGGTELPRSVIQYTRTARWPSKREIVELENRNV